MDKLNVLLPESEEVEKLNKALHVLDLMKCDVQSLIDDSKKLNEKLELPSLSKNEVKAQCLVTRLRAKYGGSDGEQTSSQLDDECCNSSVPYRSPVEIKNMFSKMLTELVNIK